MKHLILATATLVLTSIDAQQMIPKQKGFEISYSVFPKSPEKQNYNLGAGIISTLKTVIIFSDWLNTAESITNMPTMIFQ